MQTRGEVMKAYPIGGGAIACWLWTTMAAALGKGKKELRMEEGVRGSKSSLTKSGPIFAWTAYQHIIDLMTGERGEEDLVEHKVRFYCAD